MIARGLSKMRLRMSPGRMPPTGQAQDGVELPARLMHLDRELLRSGCGTRRSSRTDVCRLRSGMLEGAPVFAGWMKSARYGWRIMMV